MLKDPQIEPSGVPNGGQRVPTLSGGDGAYQEGKPEAPGADGRLGDVRRTVVGI